MPSTMPQISPKRLREGRTPDVANASLTQVLRHGVVLLDKWWRRMQDRNQLANMTERELRDFGLSRQDADQEIRKPFWRE
jgi:uncharacterized protein YjiS (DUF1127 family)